MNLRTPFSVTEISNDGKDRYAHEVAADAARQVPLASDRKLYAANVAETYNQVYDGIAKRDKRPDIFTIWAAEDGIVWLQFPHGAVNLNNLASEMKAPIIREALREAIEKFIG